MTVLRLLLLAVLLVHAPGSWTKLGAISGTGVCALVMSGPGDVWAGTVTSGLYHGGIGSPWHRVAVPDETGPACPLTLSPDGRTLVAVTDGPFVSRDEGVTWQPLDLPYAPAAVALDETEMLAAGDQGQLDRSMDSGATWSPLPDWQAGLPAAGHFIVYDLSLNGNDAFLATGDGIYRSVDAGRTWAWANAGLPTVEDQDPASGQWFERVPRAVAVVPVPGTTVVYAALQNVEQGSLYRSDDDGAKWRLLSSVEARPTSLAVSSGTLWLGTHDRGVLVSRDGGATWTSFSHGLFDRDVAALALSPGGDGAVLAGGSEDGPFFLDGSRWSPLFGGMPSTDPVTALLPVSGTVVAGTLSGVFRSNDGGASWVSDDSGLPGERSINGLAAATGTVYAATVSGLWTQSSGSWHPTGSRPMRGISVQAVATSPNGDSVAAGTENGLFDSVDGGRWHMAATGDMNVTQVAWSPSARDPSDLYALCDGRLERYRGTEGTILGGLPGGRPITSFAFARSASHPVATTAVGIYRFDRRWTRILSASLGDGAQVVSLGGGRLLAAGVDRQYLSGDFGAHWTAFATPHHVPILSAMADGTDILVSLLDHGVWRFHG